MSMFWLDPTNHQCRTKRCECRRKESGPFFSGHTSEQVCDCHRCDGELSADTKCQHIYYNAYSIGFQPVFFIFNDFWRIYK